MGLSRRKTVERKLDGKSRVRASMALALLLLFPSLTASCEDDPPEPICVNGVDCDWVAAESSQHRGCALRSDGTVYCWGSNHLGQLGDGTTKHRGYPVQVRGLNDAVALSVGVDHACVKNADGTAWCWGENDYGQIGDGTLENRASPVQILLPDEVVTVTAYYNQTSALLSDGTVWRWGAGYEATPERLPDIDDVTSLSNAGRCAVRNDSTAWCWGNNGSGRLGWGRWDESEVPVQVVGLTDVVQVSEGTLFACAVTEAEEAWCWGRNGAGQLGDGTTEDASAPVKVETDGGALTITAGDRHACGTWRDGSARCWGDVIVDRQGYRVLQLTSVRQIHAGDLVTVAVTTAGTLLGWGYLDNLPLRVDESDISEDFPSYYVDQPFPLIDPYPPDAQPRLCFPGADN
ncbi:RCC1 domain-containing protein [Myxococcota bacterium]